MEKIENKWSNLFIIVGIAQFLAVGVLTVIIVFSHMGDVSPVLSTIMTYTDAEFTPGLWFTFGYQMYILGCIGVLVFGFVYRHIENTTSPYNKKTNFLAGFHLVLMNVGLVVSTFTIMIAGWVGGIAMVGEDWGGMAMESMAVHNEIFLTLVPLGVPIWTGLWILVMSAGIIFGSIGLIIRLVRR